jgi:hypothetical protein
MEPSCEALIGGGFTSVLTAKEQRTLLKFLTGPHAHGMSAPMAEQVLREAAWRTNT